MAAGDGGSGGLVSGDPAALAAIDRVVRRQVLRSSVLRVKLWTAAGRVAYSDELRLIGPRFRLGSQERAALARHAVYAEMPDLQRRENRFERGPGKLLGGGSYWRPRNRNWGLRTPRGTRADQNNGVRMAHTVGWRGWR
jgi:hypothetical protein